MDCVNETKIGLARISAAYGFGVQVSKEFLTKTKEEIKGKYNFHLLQAGNYYDNIYRYYLVIDGETIEEISDNKKFLQEFIDDWHDLLSETVDKWDEKKHISKIVDVVFA